MSIDVTEMTPMKRRIAVSGCKITGTGAFPVWP